jgi:tetratricopeptide (TPR) repeat protein
VRPQAPSAEHRAAEEPPSDAAALEEARALLAEGRDEQALALLLGATRRPGPHRGRLLSLLGDAHRVAGRFAEAAAAYEQALATPTPPPGVVAELAGLQETALGRADEARLTWARYLEQHPRGRYAAQAHMELARLSPAPGEAAEGHLRAALTLAPGTPEAGRAYVGLGRRLLDAKRWSEAEALFEPALDDRQAARAEAALVGLMRVRLAQGRPDEVRALAERHTERFESGARADEVARILRALD